MDNNILSVLVQMVWAVCLKVAWYQAQQWWPQGHGLWWPEYAFVGVGTLFGAVIRHWLLEDY